MEYDDQEISVHNESSKRERTEVPGKDANKRAKKRRSSLATTRRSITGNYNSFSESRYGNDPEDEASSAAPRSSGLCPNPANLHMDHVIKQVTMKVKTLDKECAQWKEELRYWEEQMQQSKLLTEGLPSISDTEVPNEIQAFALKEYVTCDQMDFSKMENQVQEQLLKLFLNINSCVKDLHLFRETVQAIETSNHLKKTPVCSKLSQFFSEAADVSAAGDVKRHIENLIKIP